MSLHAPVSVGEFVDKYSILEIKAERIADDAQRANVVRERDALRAAWAASPLAAHDLAALAAELRGVNEALWTIEDRIRAKEAARQFDDEFVELARSVYRTNDRRAELKRDLNRRLGSDLVEEKSYTRY
jgi:hypothetical protein